MMTYEESLECFEKLRKSTLFNEADKVAMKAILKQIPKKPIGDSRTVPHYKCPDCGSTVQLYRNSMRFPYCSNCGQALKWG